VSEIFDSKTSTVDARSCASVHDSRRRFWIELILRSLTEQHVSAGQGLDLRLVE
jgi:hypothetical protein